MKRFLKGFVICISLVALLSCCVFFSFNKPKQVKAEPIALGVGALGALVAAYFATSGVELASSGMDASQYSSYLDSEIRSWDSASVSRFFLSDGSPQANVGLALIGNEVGQYYISMGQGITNMLETFKDWFVTEHSLSSDSVSEVYSSQFLTIGNVHYPLYIDVPREVVPSVISLSNLSSDWQRFYINSSVYFEYRGNPYANGVTVYLRSSSSSATPYVNVSNSNSSKFINYFYLLPNGNLVFQASVLGVSTINTPLIQNFSDATSISVEGTLNEGYEDFEEALRQDQTQEEENSDAVYGLGVGTYEGVATPDLVLDGILERILAGTYEGTYEGVYENEEEFTEEKEQSSSGSISVPAGWVTISGLQDFFPWCIPFDLYNVIAIFNAPAQAPRFTWRMDFGGRFAPYDIDIDLSAWNTVAQVFRIMVVVVFLVFIIIKTRDLIRG